jgi:hypothetical protein
MIDSTFGISIAAPMPWTRRAMTSSVAVPATPQAAEASVNTASPIENVRRRPIASPSRAAGIRNTAEVSA